MGNHECKNPGVPIKYVNTDSDCYYSGTLTDLRLGFLRNVEPFFQYVCIFGIFINIIFLIISIIKIAKNKSKNNVTILEQFIMILALIEIGISGGWIFSTKYFVHTRCIYYDCPICRELSMYMIFIYMLDWMMVCFTTRVFNQLLINPAKALKGKKAKKLLKFFGASILVAGIELGCAYGGNTIGFSAMNTCFISSNFGFRDLDFNNRIEKPRFYSLLSLALLVPFVSIIMSLIQFFTAFAHIKKEKDKESLKFFHSYFAYLLIYIIGIFFHFLVLSYAIFDNSSQAYVYITRIATFFVVLEPVIVSIVRFIVSYLFGNFKGKYNPFKVCMKNKNNNTLELGLLDKNPGYGLRTSNTISGKTLEEFDFEDLEKKRMRKYVTNIFISAVYVLEKQNRDPKQKNRRNIYSGKETELYQIEKEDILKEASSILVSDELFSNQENISLTVVDCAPKIFSHLRELDGIDTNSMIRSLMPTKNKDNIKGSEGKGGASFFNTYDNQYMLKTLNLQETELIRSKMLYNLDTYLSSNNTSIISRIYGLFKLKVKTGLFSEDSHYIVIMKNVCGTFLSHIKYRFDMKGSTLAREVKTEEPEKDVLKDINFQKMEGALRIPSEDALRLKQQIIADANFLYSTDVMDYSLFVVKLTMNQQEIEELFGPQHVQNMINEKNKILGTNENLSSSGIISLRDSFLIKFDKGNVQNLRKYLFPSFEWNTVYIVAIIDFFQLYDVNKKLETAFKRLKTEAKDISSANPTLYKERFIEQMSKICDIKNAVGLSINTLGNSTSIYKSQYDDFNIKSNKHKNNMSYDFCDNSINIYNKATNVCEFYIKDKGTPKLGLGYNDSKYVINTLQAFNIIGIIINFLYFLISIIRIRKMYKLKNKENQVATLENILTTLSITEVIISGIWCNQVFFYENTCQLREKCSTCQSTGAFVTFIYEFNWLLFILAINVVSNLKKVLSSSLKTIIQIGIALIISVVVTVICYEAKITGPMLTCFINPGLSSEIIEDENEAKVFKILATLLFLAVPTIILIYALYKIIKIYKSNEEDNKMNKKKTYRYMFDYLIYFCFYLLNIFIFEFLFIYDMFASPKIEDYDSSSHQFYRVISAISAYSSVLIPPIIGVFRFVRFLRFTKKDGKVAIEEGSLLENIKNDYKKNIQKLGLEIFTSICHILENSKEEQEIQSSLDGNNLEELSLEVKTYFISNSMISSKNIYSNPLSGQRILEDETINIKLEEIAPNIFSYLRKLDNINDFEMEKSFLPDDNREKFDLKHNEGGKGGAFFIQTYDKQYLLKTITNEELDFLKKTLLPKYILHLKNHPDSLLARIYGCYTRILPDKKIHYIVMKDCFNIFKSPENIKEIYDLKGSKLGRFVKTSTISNNKVLKDINFEQKEGGLMLNIESVQKLMDICQLDSEFLRDLGVMDYSLLVVKIDFNIVEVEKVFGKSHISDKFRELEEMDQGNFLVHEDKKPKSGEMKDLKDKNDIKIDVEENKEPEFTIHDNRKELNFNPNLVGGIKKYLFPSVVPNKAYIFAIIDYFQLYNVSKHLETFLKKLKAKEEDISSMEPIGYCKRFNDNILGMVGYYLNKVKDDILDREMKRSISKESNNLIIEDDNNN